MKRATRALPFIGCLAISALVGSTGWAFIPGGGTPTNLDCFGEFSGTDANYPPTSPKEIRCIDGDPACDVDPTPYVCGIAIGICFNVTDPNNPSCTPHPIMSDDIRNSKPGSKFYDPAIQQLQDYVNAIVPLPGTEHDVCTQTVVISVPLRYSSAAHKYNKWAKTLHTHLDADGGVRTLDDLDTLKITCLPPPPAP